MQAVITTKGDQGSILFQGRDRVDIPIATASQLKDPTGAGDAYRSGLIKAMSKGLDLSQACLWGAVLASFAVSCYGTQEYQVDIDEFNSRLQELGAEI